MVNNIFTIFKGIATRTLQIPLYLFIINVIERGVNMLKIGGILKAKMHEKDIRQKELADMMELDQRTISNYCNDINFPNLDTLSRLCNILEIDINDILEIHAKGNSDILIQSDLEMKLLEDFRKLSKEKQKEFLKASSCIIKIVE